MKAKAPAAAEGASTREEPGRSSDGHVLLDGARWHYPAPGRPHECAVPGCVRVLGQQPSADADEDQDGMDEDR